MADDAEPKLHVDTDWKAQAAAERQRLAEKAKQQQAASQPGGERAAPGGVPPANFETLISTLVTQALFAMGAIPHPATGQRMQNLGLARHHIDMIALLETKTKGNLTEDETKLLTQTLYELRQRYIQLASAATNR